VVPYLVGPDRSVGDVPLVVVGEYAVEVLPRRWLQVCVSEVGDGPVADFAPGKGSLQEEGKSEDELHLLVEILD
jgi:hypothetical protein